MSAAAAFLLCLILLIPGCQKSCTRPAPAPPPPTETTPSETATPVPSPTPLPASARHYPCVSDTLAGSEFDYTAEKPVSLHLISAQYGIDSRIIGLINHLSRRAVLKKSQKIHMDNRHVVPCDLSDGIIVNLPQRWLFLYRGGKLEAAHPVAVGMPDWETPTGGFMIVRMTKNPTWVVPKSIQEEAQDEGKFVRDRIPPGPGNPLGNYWMGTSLPGIGIHATNAPASIYSWHTHGCVRLEQDNADDIFKRIAVGEGGMMVYEPVLFAKLPDGHIWMEADRDIYDRSEDETADARNLAGSTNIGNLIDWNLAQDVVKEHDGLAHDVTAR